MKFYWCLLYISQACRVLRFYEKYWDRISHHFCIDKKAKLREGLMHHSREHKVGCRMEFNQNLLPLVFFYAFQPEHVNQSSASWKRKWDKYVCYEDFKHGAIGKENVINASLIDDWRIIEEEEEEMSFSLSWFIMNAVESCECRCWLQKGLMGLIRVIMMLQKQKLIISDSGHENDWENSRKPSFAPSMCIW